MNNFFAGWSRDPLRFGEVISATFRQYLKNARTNLIFSVLIFGLAQAVILVISGMLFTRSGLSFENISDLAERLYLGEALDYNTILETMPIRSVFVPSGIFGFLVQVFITPLTTGGIIAAAIADRKGGDSSFSASFGIAAAHYKQLFIVNICSMLVFAFLIIALALGLMLGVTIGGLIAAISPIIGIPVMLVIFIPFVAVCILLSANMIMSFVVAIEENVGGFSAVTRGYKLLFGRVWFNAGCLVVVAVLGCIVTTVLSYFACLPLESMPVTANVVYTVIGTFATPLTIVAVVILYFETRLVKEGYDVPLTPSFDSAYDNDSNSGPDYL